MHTHTYAGMCIYIYIYYIVAGFIVFQELSRMVRLCKHRLKTIQTPQIHGGCASFTAGGGDDQVADDGRKHATPIGDHPGIRSRVQG